MSTAIPAPSRRSRFGRVVRYAIPTCAIGVALSVAGMQVPALWREWSGLQQEKVRLRDTEVIGYVGVSPNPSYAQKPEPWIIREGDATRIWGTWRPGVGHTWFQFKTGDFDTHLLDYPLGRDMFRAIDKTLVEVGGGERWDRLPYDALVIPVDLGGLSTAYPVRLLQLSLVVNDRFGDRPALVVYHPQSKKDEVSIYDPVLDGEVVTFGTSGHAIGHAPLLYDRSTESLWDTRGETLSAITGPRKGAHLKRIARLVPVSWSQWSSRHADGRLVIGAERPEPPRRPTEVSSASPRPANPPGNLPPATTSDFQ